MTTRRTTLAAAYAAALVGCTGSLRETTTPRSATEQLLISTAARRAVERFDASGLSGQRVFIDDAQFESVDKPYVVSLLRHHLSKAGATVVPAAAPAEDGTGAQLVLEIRNASVGIWDADFTLGVPPLFVETMEGMMPTLLPPLFAYRRLSQEGWAKLQLWVYDAATKEFVGKSPDLWGASYYNQWWVLMVGPFDGSNDIYPDEDLGLATVTGAARDEEDEEDEEEDED